MTQQHDFKAALEVVPDWDGNLADIGLWGFGHKDVIQAALRIADRVQGGEVSEGMLMATHEKSGVRYHNSDDVDVSEEIYTDIFTTMADKLIEEESQ